MNPFQRLPWLGLVAIIALGCTSSPPSPITTANYRQIEDGQTEEEVTARLGPPTSAEDGAEVRTLVWESGKLRITARFLDGKLVGRHATYDGLGLADDPGAETPEPKADAGANPRNGKTKPTIHKPRPPRGDEYASIWERARATVDRKFDFTTEAAGSMIAKEEERQVELSKDGAVAVGMVISWNLTPERTPYICGLQLLWKTESASYEGELLGKPGQFRSEVRARTGYAMSGVSARENGQSVWGLKARFMRIDGDGLDIDSEQESALIGWDGDTDSKWMTLTGQGRPIVGAHVNVRFIPGKGKVPPHWRMTGLQFHLAPAKGETTTTSLTSARDN